MTYSWSADFETFTESCTVEMCTENLLIHWKEQDVVDISCSPAASTASSSPAPHLGLAGH
ncbi:hypothetical protein IEO21_10020 [Rhodonia placenta]|uniref:Uncharacterized protein n=1 Tax=Rhodonia placenta TaxID=104341 RepID=A0A8H7NTM1_9APHY|nr:hypothetical protein IEO21_10020 [Postia placenta]